MKNSKYYGIVIAFIVLSAIFIYKTSFIIDGVRYFSLFDDAMVSMNYARNLAGGNGLVMNSGEHVEGITNPLWTCWMAAVHKLPVSQPKMSLVIQITGLLLLLGNLHFVRKTARYISGDSPYAEGAAVFLTAFYLPLINWTLQGMETGLQAFLVSVAVWRALAGLEKRTVLWDMYLILGLGTLVRIDMTAVLAVMTVLCAYLDSGNRKKHLIFGAITMALFVGGQTLARIAYYGDPLPNTYYLKMTGYPILLRFSRGFLVWWSFLWNMNLLLVAASIFILAANFRKELLIPAGVFAVQNLYSIYVGGDAWEEFGGSNRYITAVMPQFFILFAYSLSKIGNHVKFGQNSIKTGGKVGFGEKGLIKVLIIYSFVQFNSPPGPLSLKSMVLFKAPPHVENNKTMVERAIIIKQITKPEATIAVSWAGAIPYFSERRTVDILGKTDKTIGKMPMRTSSGADRFRFFLPGHLKYDYGYSIGKLQPDAVLQFWGDLKEAEPYIADKYTKLVAKDKVLYLKNGSENILWEKFSKQHNP